MTSATRKLLQAKITGTIERGLFVPQKIRELQLSADDILKAMGDIKYGWSDVNGKVHLDIDPDEFASKYRLQPPAVTWYRKVGVCWDQTELARFLLEASGYLVKTVFIQLGPMDSHTFVIFSPPQEGNGRGPRGYFWFEHSYARVQGIYGPFRGIKTPIELVRKAMLEEWSNVDVGTRFVTIFQPPKAGSSCVEFVDFCRSSEPVPNMNAADVMFRAGPERGIKRFLPRKPVTWPSTLDVSKVNPYVMLTSECTYAAAFSFDWSETEGFRLEQSDDGRFWTLTVPNEFKDRLQQPCSMYSVSTRTPVTFFGEVAPGVTTPEYISYTPCTVVREQKFPTAEACCIAHHVTLKYV